MNVLIKKTLLTLLVAPLAFGSVSAMAKGQGSHHQGNKSGQHQKGHCGSERGIWKQLDLTDAQKTEMKELRKADRAAMKAGRDTHKTEAKANKQQMENLILSSSFDENAVRTLAQSMVEKRVDGQVAMAKAKNKQFNLLTAEQQAKFKALKAEKAKKCEAKKAERAEKPTERKTEK